MTEEPTAPELHHVELDVEAEVLIASEEHQADLIREFQLISMGAEPGRDGGVPLPRRLADLIVELLRDYTGAQEENLTAAHAAVAQGERTVHLVMDLPVAAVDAIHGILGALEEADDYCRRGEGLLTLATPPRIAEVRRWFVEEVTRQIEASVRARATAG